MTRRFVRGTYAGEDDSYRERSDLEKCLDSEIPYTKSGILIRPIFNT